MDEGTHLKYVIIEIIKKGGLGWYSKYDIKKDNDEGKRDSTRESRRWNNSPHKKWSHLLNISSPEKTIELVEKVIKRKDGNEF